MDRLHSEQCSCVVYNNGETKLFHRKGVIDLHELLKTDPIFLNGALVADKVIGRAAAAILIVAGVKELYTDVISQGGLKLLESSNIKISYTEVIEYVLNRTGDDLCPLERASIDADTAEDIIAILDGWRFPEWIKKRD